VKQDEIFETWSSGLVEKIVSDSNIQPGESVGEAGGESEEELIPIESITSTHICDQYYLVTLHLTLPIELTDGMNIAIFPDSTGRGRFFTCAGFKDEDIQYPQLLVVDIPDGVCSAKFRQVGTQAIDWKIKAASSPFQINDVRARYGRNLLAICTGSGLAPYLSWIQAVQYDMLDIDSLTILYGCRTEDDNILSHMKLNPKKTKIITVHSRMSEKQYVQDRLKELNIKSYDGIYICGNDSMTKTCKTYLKEQEVNNVHYELWG
jgi:hypothetical protein